jgi:hypothetical protein
MKTYTLYHLNFKKYLLLTAAVEFLLLLFVFFLIRLNYLTPELWEASDFALLAFASMVLSVLLGFIIAMDTYEIRLDNKGIQMNVRSSYFARGYKTESIEWNDLAECYFGEYDEGNILSLNIISTGAALNFRKYPFMQNKDILPFYEAVRATQLNDKKH